MLEISLIHQVFTLLIVLTSIYLGFLVYFSNKQSKTKKLFFILAIITACWITFYYLTISQATIFWGKLSYATVSIFFIFFYLFFIYFLELEKKLRFLTNLIIIIGIIFFFISIFTDWIVEGVIIKNKEICIFSV